MISSLGFHWKPTGRAAAPWYDHQMVARKKLCTSIVKSLICSVKGICVRQHLQILNLFSEKTFKLAQRVLSYNPIKAPCCSGLDPHFRMRIRIRPSRIIGRNRIKSFLPKFKVVKHIECISRSEQIWIHILGLKKMGFGSRNQEHIRYESVKLDPTSCLKYLL